MSECGRTDIVTTVDGRELLFRCDREGWDHPGRHHATNVEGVELFWSRSGEARAASQERPQTGREPKHTEGQGEMCDPDCPHWSARWEQHDDSCECHIGICADCGCTNEARAAPQERPQPKLDRLRLLLGAYLSTEQYEECRDLLDASQERPPIDVELLEAIENVLYSDSMDPDDHLHWSHLRSLVKDRRSRLSGSVGE